MEAAFARENYVEETAAAAEANGKQSAADRIYEQIAERTGNCIFIGVTGPVRTGKSTLIKRFMEEVVLPRIDGAYKRERALDELPQSGAGKTVTTTEPKFIPEEAGPVPLGEGAQARIRLVDCVGYMVPSAIGYLENEAPRMVRTPWFDKEIPFDEAAEYGTRKVITDHATIGLAVTTDGSIGNIPREEYIEPEKKVVRQLQELGKPFVLLLNSVHPEAEETVRLAEELADSYHARVMPVSCAALTEKDFVTILTAILDAFPVREIRMNLPAWIASLERENELKSDLYRAIADWGASIGCMADLRGGPTPADRSEWIDTAAVKEMDYGAGSAKVEIRMKDGLFYRVLSEKTGLEITGEADLMNRMAEMAEICARYRKIQPALEEVEATGYGIVMPGIEELSLEEPEIVRQNGRFGVRLRAAAPSIHMMRADITTEISPIVGSERQSEELVNYLMEEFREDPLSIWQSNIFGTSLHELVNEGLHNKLQRMPSDARMKLQETIERIINEGCGGLICIIL